MGHQRFGFDIGDSDGFIRLNHTIIWLFITYAAEDRFRDEKSIKHTGDTKRIASWEVVHVLPGCKKTLKM
jgi:hypothetical protein